MVAFFASMSQIALTGSLEGADGFHESPEVSALGKHCASARCTSARARRRRQIQIVVRESKCPVKTVAEREPKFRGMIHERFRMPREQLRERQVRKLLL